MTTAIPRRIRLDMMTTAELAIESAVKAVERAGCDYRLTEAINLLHEAQDRVADYVDGTPEILRKNTAVSVNCRDSCDGTGPVYPGDYGWMCADCFPTTEAKR